MMDLEEHAKDIQKRLEDFIDWLNGQDNAGAQLVCLLVFKMQIDFLYEHLNDQIPQKQREEILKYVEKCFKVKKAPH